MNTVFRERLEPGKSGGGLIPVEGLPFVPPRFGRNPHYQTIASNLLGLLPGYRPKLRGIRSEAAVIPTECGTGDRIFVHIHRFTGPGSDVRPAAMLVHGMEGSTDSYYMVQLTEKLLRAGFHVLRMNLRGCGEGESLSRYLYSARLTIDLEVVLRYAREQISRHVALVGFSMGASLTLKFMGEDQAERNEQRLLKTLRRRRRARRRWEKPIRADVFVAVSPPLDLFTACEVLDSPSARVYRDRFLREARLRVSKQGKFDHIPRAIEELPLVTSWFEFDHLYVAPTMGFPGAPEYYEHCSSRRFVSGIEAPGLVLHAADDPLISMVGWKETNWASKPNIRAELTEHGGHVGWRCRKTPGIPDRRWMDYRLLWFLTEWRDSLKGEPTRKRRWWFW